MTKMQLTQIRVFAGSSFGDIDDEDTIEVEDLDDEDACVQAAIDWSAGRWPESDSGYIGAVWAETIDGERIGFEELSISADGEIDEP